MISTFLMILSLFSNNGNSVKDEIKNYLDKKLSNYESYEFEIASNIKEGESFKVVEEDKLNINGSYLYLPVLIKKNGKEVRSFLSLKVKIYSRCLVAGRTLNRKEKLSLSDFRFSRVDITGINGSVFTDTEKLEEYLTKSVIKQGSVLIKEIVEPVPVIQAGDKISANSVYGNVKLTTDAVSRQDGLAGEVITVITSDKKQFKAKVIDRNNVLIIE